MRETALQRAWTTQRQPQPYQTMFQYMNNPVYAAIILRPKPMFITFYLSGELPLDLIIRILGLLNIPEDILALTYQKYNHFKGGGGGGGGGGGSSRGSGKKQKLGLYNQFTIKLRI